MNLFEYVGNRKEEISAYLEVQLKEKASQTDKKYAHLYDSLREFAIKGKHLRGCLFLFSYEMAGGSDINAVLPIAAAIEINGSALLIHDDIMDNDLLRRGGPSMFAQYIEEGKKMRVHNPKEYGVGTGILIGDIAIILGFELLDRTLINRDIRSKVLQRYAQDMQITAVGQMMDFDFSSVDQEPTEEEILKIYSLKTAQYSLINPFLMGAEAVGASKEYCRALLEIAKTLGIIFQIRDDVMGLLGDEKVTGKAARSDVRENKKTLIRRYLFEAANEEQTQHLLRVFGNKDIADKDFEALINFVKTSGVEEKIDNQLKEMANEVLKKLDALKLDEKHHSMMKELVQYSLTRAK
jgi:geranylgeranyl pyrophosphate synthase